MMAADSQCSEAGLHALPATNFRLASGIDRFVEDAPYRFRLFSSGHQVNEPTIYASDEPVAVQIFDVRSHYGCAANAVYTRIPGVCAVVVYPAVLLRLPHRPVVIRQQPRYICARALPGPAISGIHRE